MKLSDFPSTRRVGRVSVIDTLPEEVREQLIEARLSGSHSTGAMVEWLKSEGYNNVNASTLSNWFQARGYRHGSHSGNA